MSGGGDDSTGRDVDNNPRGVCKDVAGAIWLPSVDGVVNGAGATTNWGGNPSVKGIEPGDTDTDVEFLGLFTRFMLL